MPTKSKKKSDYKLTVTLNDKTTVYESDDLPATFLSIKPKKVTTKVLIRLEYQGKVAERWLYPMKARFVFTNKVTAVIFTKRLKLLLK